MAAVGEDSASLASQCLALCQTLASQGHSFTFSLSIGSNFNFSMTTSLQENSAPATASKVVKRKSPSTRRRNARRRREFLQKKLQPLSSTFQPAEEDIIDATLAKMPHRVEDYADFWETGEIEVYVDAPTSLPASSQPPTIPHYIPSKASYSSVAASAPAPIEKKANPLLCTHCGLSKFGHPGPTGDRCHVPKLPNL